MKSIHAEIITIGNEILAGYTVNTNATFISQQLLGIGISVGWVTTIRDTEQEILQALTNAQKRADIVLISGGLGPTPDDITKMALCTYFDTKMIYSPAVFEDVKMLLQQRKLHLLESNRNQAMVPDKAIIMRNPFGTAPGLILEKASVQFFFMPGVPQELKAMTSGPVLDHLKKTLKRTPIHTHLLRTTGITEAGLYELIKALVDTEEMIQVSFLPRGIGVDLRLKLVSSSKEEHQRLTSFIDQLKQRIGKYVFTEEDITMQEYIGRLLKEKGLTLAIAESFTGGVIANWITDIPGCSDYFSGGIVTYSNKSKTDLLGVGQETIDSHGAVSKETLVEMLRGARQRFQSDCAIATTGIAGPAGGSAKKPVGLCYVGALFGEEVSIKKFNFGNNRLRTKNRGAMAGLEILRRLILGIE